MPEDDFDKQFMNMFTDGKEEDSGLGEFTPDIANREKEQSGKNPEDFDSLKEKFKTLSEYAKTELKKAYQSGENDEFYRQVLENLQKYLSAFKANWVGSQGFGETTEQLEKAISFLKGKLNVSQGDDVVLEADSREAAEAEKEKQEGKAIIEEIIDNFPALYEELVSVAKLPPSEERGKVLAEFKIQLEKDRQAIENALVIGDAESEEAYKTINTAIEVTDLLLDNLEYAEVADQIKFIQSQTEKFSQVQTGG